LIFVTGKGGVGRSTVAGALGLAAARRGMRTIVAELTGESRLARAYGVRDVRVFEEFELAPGLFTISISPEQAMEEYLVVKAPDRIGHLLGQSRLFQTFAMATPGMRELLSLGKAWELAQPRRRTQGAAPYDLVIVDAPATGHGIGMLKTPRTFSEIARVGPVAHQGQTIAQTIADRDFTGILAVCTAEEMPVAETLSLHEALLREHLGLDAVVVNARYPDRFAEDEQPILAEALSSCPAPSETRATDPRFRERYPAGPHLPATSAGKSSPTAPGGRSLAATRPSKSPLVRAAIRAAISEHTRAATQAEQQQRLHEAFPGCVLTLPFVFATAIEAEQLGLLAAIFDRELS
jgi:anion-transporting  ArsA/GET3 family ATPase